MLASAFLYAGATTAGIGLVARWLLRGRRAGSAHRWWWVLVTAAGVATAVTALLWPAPDQRAEQVVSSLDRFAPVWQFREHHALHIGAPPDRVFAAIEQVRADEIFLFRTLIRIRAGGRTPSAAVRTLDDRGASLIDVATSTTFVRLANVAPHELVVGTLVGVRAGPRPKPAEADFLSPPPGFVAATMSFVVTPDGAGGSNVSTETRVFAAVGATRRRFAVYWRIIYPGSAFIRRAWLQAIARRATGG